VKINCIECSMYRSEHCDDCLVTALLHPPAEEVEWAEDLEAPLGALAEGGLIPVLRFRPRPGLPTDEDRRVG
jgi:hypothetical protein